MSDWISETLYSNGVLKNKLHIHDSKELEKKEYELSARNALFLLQKKPQINDIGDLKKVHQFLFDEAIQPDPVVVERFEEIWGKDNE